MDAPHTTLAARLEDALLQLDRVAVAELMAGLVGSMDRTELADTVVSPALLNIGRAWEEGTAALSQVYMAGRIMEDALEKAMPSGPPRPGAPRVGVAVFEDQHALGKRIVCAVLNSAGFDVRDLGSGLGAEALAARAAVEEVDLLMVSVLMLNRALHLPALRTALRARGLGHVKLVVGGAPFVHDPTLGARIGADHAGRSAADALRFAAAWERGER